MHFVPTVIASEASAPIDLLGEQLLRLARDRAEWSQATFGSDTERGPIGALEHLAKEAGEAIAAWDLFIDPQTGATREAGIHEARMELQEEFADCLLLLLDASRRAGMSPEDLVRAATLKMVINRERVWPTPESNKPVEHVR